MKLTFCGSCNSETRADVSRRGSPVPEAVITVVRAPDVPEVLIRVVRAPDDGYQQPKHVELSTEV